MLVLYAAGGASPSVDRTTKQIGAHLAALGAGEAYFFSGKRLLTLLDGYGFGQVAGLVDISAAFVSDVVG